MIPLKTSTRRLTKFRSGVLLRLLCAGLAAGILVGTGSALGHQEESSSHAVDLGIFKLTTYYMAQAQNPGGWPVYGEGCDEVLARVSESFHFELSREGSGRLRDGRIINFEERCDCAEPGFQEARICYSILERSEYPWGRGALVDGRHSALQPFRSIAVDPVLVPLGSLVYVPLLRGKRTPQGRVLDGCFRAEDTGSLITGRRVDLFSGTSDWSTWFHKTYKISRVRMYGNHARCRSSAG